MDGQTAMRAASSGPVSLRLDSTKTLSGKPGAVHYFKRAEFWHRRCSCCLLLRKRTTIARLDPED